MSISDLDLREIGRFFSVLGYGPQDEIEFRLIGGGPPVSEWAVPSDSTWAKLLRHNAEGRNVYFGVAKRRDRRGDKAHVVETRCLWSDLDAKDFDPDDAERGKGLAVERYLGYDKPPSVVVDSGNGYHCYWVLRDPLPLSDAKAQSDLEGCLRGLSEDLRADVKCAEVARILRVPGFMNLKDPARPRPVVIVEINETRVYDLSAFRSTTPAKSKSRDPVDDSIQSGSRDDTLTSLAGAMRRRGMSQEAIEAALLVENDQRCVPPLSRREVEKIARSVSRYDPKVDPPELEELNAKYAAIGDYGGKFRVLEEFFDVELGRQTFNVRSVGDWSHWFDNRVITLGEDEKGKPITMPLAKWWLQHSGRRQYDRIMFLPQQSTPPEIYNPWRGFAVEPAEGSCALYLAHLRDVICGGDPSQYEYLVRWMASAVQHPDEPGRVAVVMRGDPGAGKGTAAQGFGRLFGRHFLHASSANHICGNFNNHLRDICVLFGDEVFSTHDKDHVGAVKRLITEDTLLIEAKGVDAILARNFIHLILASNEDWVVALSRGDRRFFCTTVDDRYAEMNAATAASEKERYFNAIQAEYSSGGQAALLHYLLHVDLSGFRIWGFPRTPEYTNQHELSLENPVERWVYDALVSGCLTPSKAVDAATGQPRHKFTRCDARGWVGPKAGEQTHLFASIPVISDLVGERVARCTKKSVGMILARLGWDRREYPRPRGYIVPPLPEARADWDRIHGASQWDQTIDSWSVDEDEIDPGF